MECAGKAALGFSGAMSATANMPRSRSLSEYTGSGPWSSCDSARTEHPRSAKSTVNLTSLFDAETSSTRSFVPTRMSILSRSSSRCRWTRYHCKGRHRGMSGRLVACRNGRPLLLWADRRFANVRKSPLISMRADSTICKSKGLTRNKKTTSAGVANSCGDRAVRVQRRLRIRDVEARKRLGAPTSTLLPRSLCYAKVAYTRERSRG